MEWLYSYSRVALTSYSRWALRWPREVARASGGFARTILDVRRGIDERKPDRMARRKVEREGEPKLRWV